jgi:hypothetical protein
VQIPCIQGGKPKKFTLQGANQKKKNYRGEKQNSPTLQGGINLFTLIFIYLIDKFKIKWIMLKFIYGRTKNIVKEITFSTQQN